MFRRSFDLILALIITGMMDGLIFTQTGHPSVRLALAIPCVFLIPGYVLMAAIFPDNVRRMAEQVTLGLGLSLITVVLGGFVLNWTPWGLSAEGWALWLTGVTVVASGVAVLRRRVMPPVAPLLSNSTAQYRAETASSGASSAVETPISGTLRLRSERLWATLRSNPKPGLLRVALFGLAAVMVILAVQVARLGALQQPTAGFTQLWVLPGDESTPQAIRIGVSNMEGQAFTYRLCLNADGVAVGDCQEVQLEDGAAWEASLGIPPAAQKVEATLFRQDLPDVTYRYVIYWPNE